MPCFYYYCLFFNAKSTKILTQISFFTLNIMFLVLIPLSFEVKVSITFSTSLQHFDSFKSIFFVFVFLYVFKYMFFFLFIAWYMHSLSLKFLVYCFDRNLHLNHMDLPFHISSSYFFHRFILYFFILLIIQIYVYNIHVFFFNLLPLGQRLFFLAFASKIC